MKIVIIGGGVTGLSAAYDLARAGHAVTILEAAPEVGGLAAGFKAEGWEWTLEKFYHHWFYNDDAVLDLIKEIGKREKVQFYSPVTSLWHQGRNLPLDRPALGSGFLGRIVNVFSLKPLKLIDRLRFGAVGLLVSKYPKGIALEKHTADSWSERWVGKAAHALIWRPMLIGKFGPLYKEVNMAWLWARLFKRTAKLGTYKGGFQAFLEDLADAVRASGVDIRLGTPVREIEPVEGGYEISTAGETLSADAVLATTSPRLLARLAPALTGPYREQLEGLKSMGAQCLILALDRPLMTDGTYWLNLPAISDDKSRNPFPFLALVEHTNYLDKAHYGGDVILYLGDYLPPDHPYFQMDEAELADLYIASLKQVNPDFDPSWIRRRWLFRAPYAQPVPGLNHSRHIPAIRTPLDRLYLACMSQVYPWDRGTNYAVEIGREAARLMLEDEKV